MWRDINDLTPFSVYLKDSVTGLGKTAVTAPTVYYAKPGGASTQLVGPTWAELDATNMPGFYRLTPSAGMVDTAGNLAFCVQKTGCIPFNGLVILRPGDAFTRLGAPAGASIAADIVALPTDADVNAACDTAISDAALATATALAAVSGLVDDLETRLTATRAGYLDNLDAAITSRLATAGYTAPDNAAIAAIAAYVDTEIAAILAAVDTEVAAIKTKVDSLNPSSIVVQNPVAANGTLSIRRNNCYHAADSRALSWTRTGWMSLTGWTVQLRIEDTIFAATATANGAEQTITVEMTRAQTAALAAGSAPFELRAIKVTGPTTTDEVTLLTGLAVIQDEL